MMTGRKPLVFALSGAEACGRTLTPQIGGEHGDADIRRFPDGETYIRLITPTSGRHVVLVASLVRPDEHVLSLILTANTARELGAASVGLISAYLPYMRQDARFRDGEGITARSFAGLLGQHVDWLVTVDPHLHRLNELSSVYRIPAVAARSGDAIGRWIAANVSAPLVVGPDSESSQWARAVGAAANAPVIIAQKVRTGDTKVSVAMPDVRAFRGCTPVLVDDIISTGHTMVGAIGDLRAQGLAQPPVCVGVHAVFVDGALEALHEAGARSIVTTNTIEHATNAIDVVPMIAGAARVMLCSAATTGLTQRNDMWGKSLRRRSSSPTDPAAANVDLDATPNGVAHAHTPPAETDRRRPDL
jgi:ribose-phosphate pyrophosphokinase